MTSTRTTRVLAATAALATSLLVAGCSGSSSGGASTSAGGGSAASSSPAAKPQPSMGELYTKVRTSSLAAKSGHLVGEITDGGQKLKLDIEGTADGSNQTAKIGIGQGTADILSVGGKYYLSGDLPFWTEQTGDAKAAKALLGKFVEISQSDATEIGDLSLGSLLEQMFEESQLSLLEKLSSTVETRTEGGTEVWVAKDGSGSEIWVDPETEHLVKLVVGGKQAGQLTFDSWDAAQTFTAPPAAKVVTP